MYKLYKEVVVKEPIYSFQKGDKGRLIIKNNGLYLVDFSELTGKYKSMYWVNPSKVKVVYNKSNYIGE